MHTTAMPEQREDDMPTVLCTVIQDQPLLSICISTKRIRITQVEEVHSEAVGRQEERAYAPSSNEHCGNDANWECKGADWEGKGVKTVGAKGEECIGRQKDKGTNSE